MRRWSGSFTIHFHQHHHYELLKYYHAYYTYYEDEPPLSSAGSCNRVSLWSKFGGGGKSIGDDGGGAFGRERASELSG